MNIRALVYTILLAVGVVAYFIIVALWPIILFISVGLIMLIWVYVGIKYELERPQWRR